MLVQYVWNKNSTEIEQSPKAIVQKYSSTVVQ
jgi:hypothetical protein